MAALVLGSLTAFLSAALLAAVAGRALARLLETVRGPSDGSGRRSPLGTRGTLEAIGRRWCRPLAPGFAARIEDALVRSGRSVETTADAFLGESVAWSVGVTAIVSMVFLFVGGRPLFLFAAIIGLVVGFYGRSSSLAAEADDRVGRIRRMLPFAVDLVVLVLGAGGTLREALEILAQGREDDPLAQELRLVLGRIDAGLSQTAALQQMADSLHLEEVSNLVLAINQGEATGAPMKTALENQADLLRYRRIQRAEKLAVEAPVKMMFPNMIIMMAVLLIILGPVFIKMASGGGLG